MKKTLCVLSLFIACAVHAQTVDIPKNYSFESPEDYARYEDDVVASIDWLVSTPLDKHTKKQEKVQQFIFTWLMGAPNVSVDLNDEIVTFLGSSPQILIIFMSGWARNTIKTGVDTKLEGNVAGIETVVEYYMSNKSLLEKDSNIEAYVDMVEEDTLREYIQKILEK
ncbi:MAG: hypothetical protein R6U95_10375 [Bacteroidales bacterium]